MLSLTGFKQYCYLAPWYHECWKWAKTILRQRCGSIPSVQDQIRRVEWPEVGSSATVSACHNRDDAKPKAIQCQNTATGPVEASENAFRCAEDSSPRRCACGLAQTSQ